MTELVTHIDLAPTSEVPSKVALITLPEVSIDGTRIRFAMHTDNMHGVLSVLENLSPDVLKKLQIEGRVINQAQFEILKEHPVYQFFMNGRVHRASISNQMDALVYTMPENTGISEAQARDLIEMQFSPRSLSSEIGFEAGYYNAFDLVELFSQGILRVTTDGELTPILGGLNEFGIGSNDLGQEQLAAIASQIHERLDQEQVIHLNSQMPSNLLNTKGYTSFDLTNTFNNSKRIDFIRQDYLLDKLDRKEIEYLILESIVNTRIISYSDFLTPEKIKPKKFNFNRFEDLKNY